MRIRKLEIAIVACTFSAVHCRTPTEREERTATATVPEPEIPVDDVEPAPVIDGDFGEWSSELLLAEDPPSDQEGAFDVTRMHASARGSELFVRLDTTTILNLYSGPSVDGTLVLAVGFGDGRELRIDFRDRSSSAVGASAPSWAALGFLAAPNHASNDFELRVDLSMFDVGEGDELSLWLEGSDVTSPVSLEVSSAAPAVVAELDLERSDAAVRVASLNTREQGLADPYRAPSIGRLLNAVEADVYCLQELGTMTDADVADALAVAGEEPLNVYGVSYGQFVRSAVASRSPLVPIHTTMARFGGAIVLLEDGPVAVFSVHLKCCGYYGSEEDESRLWEADMLRSTIAELRAGTLGAAYTPYADVPIVIMGDFNDVGSPQLQGLFTAYPLEFDRARPIHAGGRDAFTWRSSGAGFPPAVLDLTLADQLDIDRAFVLDSTLLGIADLTALGIEPEDSSASDHLLVVADFLR